ncbi:recombination regulator RecX [Secundilactobacillus kimchicus]|uniref:recombination regulator RecX n=1 Tax=Secundilactobacillus kimchicus TaxID=528209 RepID=UPI001C0229D0|nr:recombination regulator RecX [Secundilactobacillus kimchicus]MBT9671724.1 recombination regulator RecX [Secundilactobacillus kimchicus]
MSDKNENGGTITKIQSQKRPGRYNIYIDDQYAFAVGEDVLIRHRLLKGTELDAGLIQQLQREDDLSKIWQRALDYLGFRQRTEQELTDYLLAKEFELEDIETVIARLKAERLVNDEHYAYSYVRTMRQTSDKGPAVISRQLQVKGVSERLIQAALSDEFDESVQLTQASEQVPKIKRQYHRDMPRIQEQKVRQRLMAKGFSSDVISQVLAETSFEMAEDEQEDLLNGQAEKLWRRHASREASDRRQKVWQALYRKGFPSDAINKWLADHENDAD